MKKLRIARPAKLKRSGENWKLKIALAALSLFVFIVVAILMAAREQVPFPNAKISGEKDYPAYASVSFTLKLNDPSAGSGQAKELSLVRKVLAAGNKKVGAALLYGKNQKSDAKVEMVQKDSDTYVITAKNNKFFKAGKYTLAVTLSDFGNSRVLTQDFSWGVLAVNTNKSIFNPNEKAKLAFSVLNESGYNDCYALLRLEIKAPDGQATVLSTENGKIKRTKDCQGDNVTYQPDYFATYQTSTEGKYQMDLKATSANGTYEIKDYFKVAANQDFEVERITATRINPVSPYTVKIKIKANKDFSGQVVENLPYAFGAKADNNGKVSFDKEKYTHTITWDKTILQGDALELSYTFKAPEKSPEFYLLGPLTIQQFNNSTIWSEARFWQIAADPTNLILMWDPANGATPSGWTCISCSTGDPFFQSFIRGNSTYGGTGGTSTETPTIATFTVNAESLDDTTAKAGANAASGATHTHTASNPTIGAGNIIPAYKSLMVIRYNSGIPTGASAIPANAIAFFDATVPTGWTRYAAQDGNYVRGDWTGTAGGANTQTHTITWQSLAAASTAQDVLVANGGTSAISAHTHTAPAQTSTTSINIEPPYITTILGKANANTSVPNAMIGMFDGAPGTGWTLKSNTGGDPFFQVFPKPAAAYGTTGGTTTHSHATETSGVSGAPSATTTNGAGALTVAADTHTHTENVTFNTGSTNVPPYTDAIFAQKAFAVSGTVRQSNESTAIGNPPCDSSTGVIDIRINGGTATTVSCSSVDSTYSATPGTVAAGDVITILLNANSTPKANTILKAGSSDATNVDLYQNVVVARSDDTSAITNANVCTFTTSMLFSCTTNNITVNSGVEFHAASGSYTAGATLTTQGTGNLHVASGSTATLDTGTSTIANNVTIDNTGTLNVNGTGGLTVNGGSITVTGTLNTTSGTPTVTMGATGSISGGGNATFYNLTTSGTGTTTYSATGTNTVNNDVSVGTGTTLNLNSNISITGSLTNTTTGIINHTANSPVVTVSGISIGGGSGNITFYRLQKAGAGTTTFSGSGTNTINNTLDATAGTLTLSTTNVITVTGNVSASTSATLNQNTSLTINGGSLLTAGTGVVNTTAGTGTVTIAGTGNIGGGGAVTVYALAVNGSQTAASTITANNSISVGSSGTFTLTGQNINSAGNFTNTTTGVIACSGTTGTVTMTGGGTLGSGNGNITFCNLATTTTGTTNFSGGGTNTVNNNVSVGTGTTLNLNSTISITGSLTNTTTGVISYTANSPIITVAGATIGGGSGNITFYRIQKAGAGTTTFSGSGINTVNNTLDATAGIFTLSTTNVITVAGNVSASTSATLNQNTALTINGGSLLTAGTGVVNTTAGTGTVTINGTGNIGGGGTVTVYALAVNGSQTAASTITANNSISVGSSGTFTLTGQNINSAGNFTNTTTGVIACSGTTGTVTMTGGGTLGSGNGNITFCNLATTTAGTTAFSGGGTNTVNNDITVGAGTTLNINSSVTVAGNFNNTTTGIIGTTAGTPTITMTGTTKTLGGGSGAITFYTLATSGTASVTFSGTGTNTVNNNVSVGAGTTLNLNSSITIAGNLTNTTTGIIGTTAGTPTVTVNGTSVGGGSGNLTFYNLTVGIAGTVTFSGGGTNTINNDFTINAGTTLNINNSVSVGGNFVNTTTGIITYSGTPTVTMTGTSKNLGGGAGAITLYNLTVSGTTSIASAITVNNDMANNGTTSGSANVTVNGNVVGTGSINMSSGTFKQRVAAGKNFGTTSTASTWVFSTLTLSNSSGSPITITTQSGGSGTITASALNIGEVGDSSTTTLDAANRSFVISGTGTPVTLSASSGVTASTSTFTYTGTGSVTLGNFSYYNLATNNTGTYSPASSPLTVTNNVTVTSGTLSLGTNDLNVGSSSVTNSGGISVAGTLSQSASATTTIVSSSAGTATIGGAGTLTFYNLTFAPTVASAPTFTLGSAASQTITINNDLTIGNGTNAVTVTANTNNPIIDINGSFSIAASGTFTAPPSASFTIAKNITNNGTFNNNLGTVTFDTTNTSVFDGSATPAIQFNNITSIIPNKTLSFTASKTFRIDGVFTVTGSIGNRINIQSTTGTQWLINLQGTSNVTFAVITNSGCAAGSLNVTLNTSNADGGNNGTCWVFSGPGVINSKVQGNTRIQGNVRFQ